MQRGHIDQLAAFAQGAGAAQRPESPGIALISVKHGIVQNDPAADERADEEVRVIPEFLAASVKMFGPTGGGGIIDQKHRKRAEFSDFLPKADVFPRSEFLGGGADKPVPLPQLERCADANAADPFADLGGKGRLDLRHAFAQKPADRLGKWVFIAEPRLRAHLSGEVQKQQIRAAPPDLQPIGKHAIRGQFHRDRGFADLAALRLSALQKAVAFQFAQDHGDCLRRQSHQSGKVAAGHRAVALKDRQQKPFVVIAQPALVHSARQFSDF